MGPAGFTAGIVLEDDPVTLLDEEGYPAPLCRIVGGGCIVTGPGAARGRRGDKGDSPGKDCSSIWLHDSLLLRLHDP